MDNYDLLEQISREKQDLKSGREYSLGKAVRNYTSKIKRGDIKGLTKDIQDKLASRTIRKKYFNHLDRPDEDRSDVDYHKPRIAVYTCVLGGYDHIVRHLPSFDNVDYFLLTDHPERYFAYEDQYQIRQLDEAHLVQGNVLANRYVKFHPAEFFKSNYDYAIYLDGNVRVMADIRKMIRKIPEETGIAMHNHRERDDIYSEAECCKLLRRGDPDKIDRQMTRYKSAGFPAHFGMNEATVIASDLKNPNSVRLMDFWWEEFIKSESYRDQLAWPFVLWENGYLIEDVGNLGNNIYKNPLVELEGHA